MSIFDENRRLCEYCGDRISDWDGSIDHTKGKCLKTTAKPMKFIDKEVRQCDLTTTTITDSGCFVQKNPVLRRGLLIIHFAVGYMRGDTANKYAQKFIEDNKIEVSKLENNLDDAVIDNL